jgi:hypothetical protein
MLDKHFPESIFPDWVISGITLANKNTFPPYGFMISKGDILSEEIVELSRKILAKDLGYPRKKLVFQFQTHGDTINRVNSLCPIHNSDGIVTDEVGTILVLSLADCCGILTYDEVNHAVGAFHSGWKGTHQNIAGKGIKKMVEEFGSNPENIKCWITPCAGAEDYEVSRDVARYFPKFVKPIGNEKFLFDMKSAIKNHLINSGIKASNIEVSPESTISDLRFHSYRRDKANSGRMAAFIGIKSSEW